MTATNQDFTLYDGDAGDPQIGPIKDGSGNVVDLSAYADIIFVAYTDPALPAVLTKKKSVGGGITFVTDGTDGLFAVHIESADTAGKSGWYFHNADLKDSGGDYSTVATGRFGIVPRGATT